MNAYYQLMAWLPLLVSSMVAVSTHLLGWHPQWETSKSIVEVSLTSLVYGGVPYAGLAIVATFWIPGHSEPQIRKLALRAPLLMLAAYAVIPVFFGILSGSLKVAAGLALFGTAAILMLGYGYVAVVFMGRLLVFGRQHAAA